MIDRTDPASSSVAQSQPAAGPGQAQPSGPGQAQPSSPGQSQPSPGAAQRHPPPGGAPLVVVDAAGAGARSPTEVVPAPSPEDRPGRRRSAAALLEAARAGDRRALARLLSWVERGGEPGRAAAALAYQAAAEPRTVGITGAPGAGKSTLTGCLLGVIAPSARAPLAVLAVDPTSPYSGGAMLGDRVRMQDQAAAAGVYVRSMATRGHLGGLSLAVPEAVRVLGAAGMGLVVVETVGVGQVEVEVASATDTTVVVVNPRWGDAIQANKAGLMEVADVFVVNKADLPGAAETRRDLQQMLDLAGHQEGRPGTRGAAESGAVGNAADSWRPPIVETVAASGQGVDELWQAVLAHQQYLEGGGRLEARRLARLERELQRVLDARIAVEVARLGRGVGAEVLTAVLEHRLDPYEAADQIVGAAVASLSGSGGSGRDD